MPDAVLPVLIGEGTGQVLEDVEVTFPEKAVEIKEPEKRVEIERCEVIPDKVIVIGRVIKNTCHTGDNLRKPWPFPEGARRVARKE